MRQYSNCLVEQCVTFLWPHLFDEGQWDIVLPRSQQRREVLGRLHLPNEPSLNPRGGPTRDARVTSDAAHHDALEHPACLAPDGRQVSPARRAGGEDRPPVRSQMQSEKDLPTLLREHPVALN